MTEKKPKAEKPTIVAPTDDELKAYIMKVVDQMIIQSSAQEGIKTILAELKSKHGIPATEARKAATIVFKLEKEKFEETNQRVLELVDRVT